MDKKHKIGGQKCTLHKKCYLQNRLCASCLGNYSTCLPSTQPDACMKALNSYKCFRKSPVTPDTFETRICLSSFYACQEMCQEACRQKSPDTLPTAFTNYPKTNSACLPQRQPSGKAILKDYPRFCSHVHIFSLRQKSFPLQNKNQTTRTYILTLWPETHQKREMNYNL